MNKWRQRVRQTKVIDLGTPAATQQGRRRTADISYSDRIEERPLPPSGEGCWRFRGSH